MPEPPASVHIHRNNVVIAFLGFGDVAVTMSSDGRVMLACGHETKVWCSTDFGATWAVISVSPSEPWYSIECDANCNTFVAVSHYSVYVVNAAGLSSPAQLQAWPAKRATAPTQGRRVSVSLDATKQAILGLDESVYVSTVGTHTHMAGCLRAVARLRTRTP